MVEVRVGELLAAELAERFGPQRSGTSGPAEWDFWGGPLAAALIGFRDFETLRFVEHRHVRMLHILDPVFGPVVFVGVLIEAGVVEIAAFSHDPDYWNLIEDDPND